MIVYEKKLICQKVIVRDFNKEYLGMGATLCASSNLAGESGSPFLLLSHPELAPFDTVHCESPHAALYSLFSLNTYKFLIYINLCEIFLIRFCSVSKLSNYFWILILPPSNFLLL